jgi:hypothetical protein
MMEKRNAYRVLVGKPEGRRPLADLTGNARIILKWILINMTEGCGVHLPYESDQWQALLDTVLNFLLSKMRGIP